MLFEIPFSVQQRYCDEGHAEIGRRTQRITGEHAESAAIGGDRLFQADLH